MASLVMDKKVMTTEVNRYMTLLSNLTKPPADFINDLDYLRGLVGAANQAEFSQLRQVWDGMKPTDQRNRTYIETGKLVS